MCQCLMWSCGAYKTPVLDAVHVSTYTRTVELEWDPKKAAANLRKHDVRFTDAYAVLEDELAVTMEDPHPVEKRYVTIGLDSLGRVLVVSYTWRGERIRIISVRKAAPSEQRQYEGSS